MPDPRDLDPADLAAWIAASPSEARDVLLAAEASPALHARLVAALPHAEDHAKLVLVQLLGSLRVEPALPALLDLLHHPSHRIRAAVVDTLAKLGDPGAGGPLLQRLELPDPSLEVRRALLGALGAVGCAEARRHLVRYLSNPDPSQRGAAAWSLGQLGVFEDRKALELALRSERIPYPKQRMEEAIKTLRHTEYLRRVEARRAEKATSEEP